MFFLSGNSWYLVRSGLKIKDDTADNDTVEVQSVNSGSRKRDSQRAANEQQQKLLDIQDQAVQMLFETPTIEEIDNC